MSNTTCCDLKSRWKAFHSAGVDRLPLLCVSTRLIISLFFRLFEGERFDVARCSTEKAADTRTSRWYRSADCHGSYKRRRQSSSLQHIRDRISQLWSQPEPNRIYIRLAQAALSVRRKLRTLAFCGKPITTRIHSVIWETDSSWTIEISISIRQAAVQLWTEPLYKLHMIHSCCNPL